MAKLSSIALVALALWAVPALARPPASERNAEALMAVEHVWLTALQRHDEPTLARILGREFVDSDFQGNAIPRAQYLAYFAHPIAPAAPALEQKFADTRVRFIAGGNVAVVTGIVISRAMASAHAVRHSRFTDVFLWRDARWQAVTGQETHFTPGKG